MTTHHPLHELALKLVRTINLSERELIEVIGRMDREKVYRLFGYPSLFRYAVEALGLTESMAYTYITVSRKGEKVRALRAAIHQGELSVGQAKRICSVINPGNSTLWIAKAKKLSQKELEREIAGKHPSFVKVRERITPRSRDRLELHCGIDRELEGMLARVRELVAQKTNQPCTLEEALKALASFYIEKQDPVRKAERALKREEKKRQEAIDPRQTEIETPALQVGVAVPAKVSPTRLKSSSARIPTKTRHLINHLHQGACQQKVQGKLCGCKFWTDIHHIVPKSDGGTHEPTNLTTLCKAHHRMAHP